VLRWLLGIEIERLHTAVRIEAERSIVFPETTVIIRDIQKLMAALGQTANGACGLDGADAPDDDDGDEHLRRLLDDLNE
jgi:hypothetical protein